MTQTRAHTRAKTRTFAFILTAYTAAFFSIGCSAEDGTPRMVSTLTTCVAVIKDGKAVSKRSGTMYYTWIDKSSGNTGGDSVEVDATRRCQSRWVIPAVDANKLTVDTISMTGSYGAESTSFSDVHGRATPNSYDSNTKVAVVDVVFDLDNPEVLDPGKIALQLKRINGLNRRPGFSDPAVSDRQRGSRADEAVASGDKAPAGPAAAAI